MARLETGFRAAMVGGIRSEAASSSSIRRNGDGQEHALGQQAAGHDAVGDEAGDDALVYAQQGGDAAVGDDAGQDEGKDAWSEIESNRGPAAKYLTVKAYEKGSGALRRDLFSDDDKKLDAKC